LFIEDLEQKKKREILAPFTREKNELENSPQAMPTIVNPKSFKTTQANLIQVDPLNINPDQ
jgi:hypothetical protein